MGTYYKQLKDQYDRDTKSKGCICAMIVFLSDEDKLFIRDWITYYLRTRAKNNICKKGGAEWNT